jgi:hypothetical protein
MEVWWRVPKKRLAHTSVMVAPLEVSRLEVTTDHFDVSTGPRLVTPLGGGFNPTSLILVSTYASNHAVDTGILMDISASHPIALR